MPQELMSTSLPAIWARPARAIDHILKSSEEKGTLRAIEMNLDSLNSVKKAAGEFSSLSGNKLNVLVNNAGSFYFAASASPLERDPLTSSPLPSLQESWLYRSPRPRKASSVNSE